MLGIDQFNHRGHRGERIQPQKGTKGTKVKPNNRRLLLVPAKFEIDSARRVEIIFVPLVPFCGHSFYPKTEDP
jgi:hypothetical protein